MTEAARPGRAWLRLGGAGVAVLGAFVFFNLRADVPELDLSAAQAPLSELSACLLGTTTPGELDRPATRFRRMAIAAGIDAKGRRGGEPLALASWPRTCTRLVRNALDPIHVAVIEANDDELPDAWPPLVEDLEALHAKLTEGALPGGPLLDRVFGTAIDQLEGLAGRPTPWPDLAPTASTSASATVATRAAPVTTTSATTAGADAGPSASAEAEQGRVPQPIHPFGGLEPLASGGESLADIEVHGGAARLLVHAERKVCHLLEPPDPGVARCVAFGDGVPWGETPRLVPAGSGAPTHLVGGSGLFAADGTRLIEQIGARYGYVRDDGFAAVLSPHARTEDGSLQITVRSAGAQRQMALDRPTADTAGVELLDDQLLWVEEDDTGRSTLMARSIGPDGPGPVEVITDQIGYRPRVQRCRSAEGLFLFFQQSPRSLLAARTAGRWRAHALGESHGDLSCHGTTAVLGSATVRTGEGGGLTITQRVCTPEGCTDRTGSVPGLAGFLRIADLDQERALVLWRDDEVVRMRVGPLAQLAEAPEVVLFDRPVVDLRVLTRGPLAAILVANGGAWGGVHVDAEGRAAPLRVEHQ